MATPTSEDGAQALRCIRYTAGTDIGMRREENQDSFGVIETPNFRFYIVADGMGGVQGGATASNMAVAIVEEILKSKKEIDQHDISEAVAIANKMIFDKGTNDPALNGMGTTFVGLAFVGTSLFIVNVGDSRAYRMRHSRTERLTEDHTLVMELVRSGTITLEQAGNHPVSHMLTRSLGPTPEVEVDCFLDKFGPFAGDKYLLCSDGLYNLVTEGEMLEVLNNHELDEATEILIDIANQRGGTDNITLLIIEVDKSFPIKEPADLHKQKDKSVIQEPGLNQLDKNGSDQKEDAVLLDPFSIPDLGEVLEASLQKNRELEMKSSQVIVDQAKLNVEQIANTKEDLDGADPASTLTQKTAQSGGRSLEDQLTEPSQIQRAVVTEVFEHQEIKNQSIGLFGGRITSRSLIIMGVLLGFIGGGISVALFGMLSPKAGSNPVVNVSHSSTSTLVAQEERGKVSPDESSLKDIKNNNSTELALMLPPIGDELSKVEENVRAPDGNATNNSNSQTTSSNSNAETVRDNLKKRQEELSISINKVRDRIDLFNKPIGAEIGELLKQADGQRISLATEIADIRNQIDTATRKLAIWHGRRTRLHDSDLTALASEVAVSSEEVRVNKEEFELASWNYLKEAEVLRFLPSDKNQKKKVDDLIEARNQKLHQLADQVSKAIDQAVRESESQITKLTLLRENLQEQIDLVGQDLEFIKLLLGKDPLAKTQRKKALEEELKALQSEYNQVSEILNNQPPKL